MRFFLIGLLVTVLGACVEQTPVKSDKLVLPEQGQIGLYYFRTSIRCETCNAIEKIIQDELAGKYRGDLKSGRLVFRQFNLDEADCAKFAGQFDVVFKSLVVLKDSQQVNLTEEAFLYVLPKPEKFKAILEQTIDQF